MAMEISVLRYLPTFVRAARELNFSATARSLGLTPAAVSKSVRSLESALGIRLFHRSTHALELTEDGVALLRMIEPLLDQLDGAIESAMATPGHARGTLRVSAPYGFGKQFIVPLLPNFCERYPEVELDLRFEDHVIDMVEARIDVGIGTRIDPRSELVCKHLCEARLFTVASPKFIDTYGAPRTPGDLNQFRVIGYRSPSSGKLRPFYFRGEGDADPLLAMSPSVAIVGTDQELVCELAARGLGIAMVGWVGLKYINERLLVPLLEEYSPQLPPMMMYYQSRENVPPKVRVFIDYVEASFERPEIIGR